MSTNRWRGLAYLGAVLCGYALFLLITLPAYWVDWLVSRASHNAVRIQQPEGTLWGGSGNLVFQSVGQERMQTRIEWSIQPLWLFTGKLQARLSSRDDGKTAPAFSALPPSMAVVRPCNSIAPFSVRLVNRTTRLSSCRSIAMSTSGAGNTPAPLSAHSTRQTPLPAR